MAVQTRWMNDGSAGLLCLCFPINFAKALGEHHFLTQAGRKASTYVVSCSLGFLQKRDAWAGAQLDTLRNWACCAIGLSFLCGKPESNLERSLGSSLWQPELRCSMFKGKF